MTNTSATFPTPQVVCQKLTNESKYFFLLLIFQITKLLTHLLLLLFEAVLNFCTMIQLLEVVNGTTLDKVLTIRFLLDQFSS
jgi:hypothetical protein